MTPNHHYVEGPALAALKAYSRDLPSWDLTIHQACDVELLQNGAFHPLDGFMTGAECQSVLDHRLWRDQFWPLPVVLDVTPAFAEQISINDKVALRDQEGVLVSVLTVTDRFPTALVAARVGGREYHPVCLAGTVEGVEAPVHHDFRRRRLSPRELTSQFSKLGWHRILGFATQGPLHQREVNETYNAARETEASLLVNVAVGAVKAEDAAHYANVHCIEHALEHFPQHTTDLVLTPLYARTADIDDVLLHALVLKNQGCTHYQVDRHYCPASTTGLDFEKTQELLSTFDEKVGITLVHTDRMVHSAKRGGYVLRRDLAPGEIVDELSTDEFIERLQSDLAIPVWYTYPELVRELKKIHRPCAQQGITVFFTGLSGSGKSSIANALLVKMMETGGRPITLLDGDIVRQNLSSELGFSREHRDLNILRIGYVASEITKHGGMAICAPIAPYTKTRRAVRKMVEAVGGFIEIHVATALDVCEERDRKGLYAKARAGIIKEFTGISDPYEIPERPELRIDTDGITPEEAAQQVILTLQRLGYIRLT